MLQGWDGQIWELGWPNLDPTGQNLSYLPLSNTPCDHHELTAVLSHANTASKGR